ncbi:MAG: M48 family metallopeptidase [Anaerolineae bacterium]|nr:M48 family metallopeptidase [Anaerolineae bacterium]
MTGTRGKKSDTVELSRDGFTIQVLRERRRKRTVTFDLDADRMLLILHVPASMPDAALEDVIQQAVEQAQGYIRRRMRRRTPQSDAGLLLRAQQLNERYFDGKLSFQSVYYASNQRKRFGSCSPTAGEIRISERLRRAPYWVLDYVLLHELTHLVEPSHNARFRELMKRYPLAERARGFLLGVAWAAGVDMASIDVEADAEDAEGMESK